MSHDKVSATVLAKGGQLKTAEVFAYLADKNFIVKGDEHWELTSAGMAAGGEYKESKQHGTYIVWPKSIMIQAAVNTVNAPKTSRIIGERFGLAAAIINAILSELGWIKKGVKGWLVTEPGERLGGVQHEVTQTGVPYVKWPVGLLDNRRLIETIESFKANKVPKALSSTKQAEFATFQTKFPAEHRATDGHMVRSQAEALIDNWLYMAELVHAYERRLPVEEEVFCGFYLPGGRIYIEYWGREDDKTYLVRKSEKIDIYKKYGFNLIELSDDEVSNLDDVLPRMLLKYGVPSY